MSVEECAVALVEAVEEDEGRTPQRIILEPVGKTDVNVRVGWRNETHPRVYFGQREDDT